MNERKRRGWLRRLTMVDALAVVLVVAPLVWAATEAPAGFDNLTNGFTSQTQFDADRLVFEEVDDVDEGLGPVYNAPACAACHSNPVTGGNTEVTELRVAQTDGFFYFEHPGGSLINSRAINPDIQERVFGSDNIQTFRSSLSLMGDAYVEAVGNSTLQSIQASQPSSLRGTIIFVPVLEAPGQTRIGRFGWKDQQATLLSFAADAYLNEMGITSPLQPTENTSNGNSVAAYDEVPDPEDAATPSDPFGTDVAAFVRFMRSLKAPPRDAALAATSDAQDGERLFLNIGCGFCHTPSITTAPAGTLINGGAFTVPAALGDKIIHPYGDFLLHDVGTGDFIIQNGGVGTFTMVRTAPLWGARTKARLMHDNENFTRNNSILRHTNEAEPIIQNYIFLSTTQKQHIVTFLNSL